MREGLLLRRRAERGTTDGSWQNRKATVLRTHRDAPVGLCFPKEGTHFTNMALRE